MAGLSPTNFRKRRRGVRRRKSGKWGAATPPFLATPSVFRKPIGAALNRSRKWRAQIWHPIAKAVMHLGTYNTPEEAGDVYTRKKLEIESVFPTARRFSYQRESYKWYAVYQDPITSSTSYLGSYDSAEVAENALNRIKCGFRSTAFDERQRNEHEQSVFTKPKGIYLLKTGKWMARISHPITKDVMYLGTYTTPQEAEDAYTKKKLEFEYMFPNVRKHDRRTEPKWYAVVHNPVTRCTTYVGTYNTAEEAEQARIRKKIEFDSMQMHNKLSNVVAAEDTHEKDGITGEVEPDLGSNVKGNMLRLHHDDAVEHEIALACTCEAGNSTITAVAKEDDCKGSSMGLENGEIPTSRSVIKDQYDMGVIDEYGKLIGEFSRMDDELWFV